MRRRVKNTIIAVASVALASYLVLAVTSFNNPKDTYPVCSKVSINIEDENTNGFLSAAEVKAILEKNRLYPLNKKMSDINPRDIEDRLKGSPFVNSAQCYKTKDGHVCVSLTQRLPIVRVKNARGADYYLDDQGGIMPNSKYTSDLIIATGNIGERYAREYLVHLAAELMGDEFWRNQVEQINVLPDMGVELVPRVGDHVVCLGPLPRSSHKDRREALTRDFVRKKIDRLEKFYKYGLSQAGWNKYSYIDLEFDNQIICKKRNSNDIQ